MHTEIAMYRSSWRVDVCKAGREALEEANPAGTLILNSQPPEL